MAHVDCSFGAETERRARHQIGSRTQLSQSFRCCDYSSSDVVIAVQGRWRVTGCVMQKVRKWCDSGQGSGRLGKGGDGGVRLGS